MNKIRLCLITKGVHTYYKNMVKNNKNISYILTRKKITRNWILGEVMDMFDGYECRKYGNLYMTMHKETSRIVWIENFKAITTEFNIDLELKNRLDKELGIEKIC